VPRTVLTAASSDSAFKSGIFVFAISSTCFAVTVPTLFLFGCRSLRDVRGALQQDGGRRRLGDERVGPVGIDRHDDRDDEALVLCGPRIEVLAEVHDVHALRTERGPNGRRRRRLAGRDLKLRHRLNFFGHP